MKKDDLRKLIVIIKIGREDEKGNHETCVTYSSCIENRDENSLQHEHHGHSNEYEGHKRRVG